MSCTSSATDPVSGPESIMPFLATGGSVWLGVLWGLSGKEHPERILLGLLWRVLWRENMKLHESTLKRNDMTKHEKHNIRKSLMDVTPKCYKWVGLGWVGCGEVWYDMGAKTMKHGTINLLNPYRPHLEVFLKFYFILSK